MYFKFCRIFCRLKSSPQNLSSGKTPHSREIWFYANDEREMTNDNNKYVLKRLMLKCRYLGKGDKI